MTFTPFCFSVYLCVCTDLNWYYYFCKLATFNFVVIPGSQPPYFFLNNTYSEECMSFPIHYSVRTFRKAHI